MHCGYPALILRSALTLTTALRESACTVGSVASSAERLA
uniref:Uncharacterized protein n=1 Tax=Anguilla anguilla TaxID=7936 RepID=A0A0E9Q9S4_ANGAN